MVLASRCIFTCEALACVRNVSYMEIFLASLFLTFSVNACLFAQQLQVNSRRNRRALITSNNCYIVLGNENLNRHVPNFSDNWTEKKNYIVEN